MHILFIAPQPFFQVRGTPLAVKSLLESLSSHGHTITLLTYPLGQDVPIQGVTVKRAPKPPGLRSIKIGPSFAKLVLDPLLFLMGLGCLLRQKFDVIHAVEEAAFLAAPLSLLFRVPLVYDMDSNMTEQLENSGFLRNKAIIGLILWMEKWVIRRSKAVVTVCGALTEHAKRLCPGAMVFQIEDPPLSPEAVPGSLREELKVKDRILAIYTGNFEPYQGVDLFLQSLALACQKVETLVGVLVGGEGERLSWAQDRAQTLGIAGRVHILAQRSPEAMGPFLQDADILVSPRTEGKNTPFKIYTYLASGKPLLATRLFTHTQVLTEEVCLLADPTPEAFSEALIRLASDASLRERLGRVGKAWADERYGRDRYEERVAAFLRHLEAR